MIVPTIHAFALPDKKDIVPTLYLLRGAGMESVIFPVPWRRYDVPDFHAGLIPLIPWLDAARQVGISPVLDVGPWFDVGLPAWELPDRILALPEEDRVEWLRRWWGNVRDTLQPAVVIVRRTPPSRADGNPAFGLSPSTWNQLLEVWKDTIVWDVTEWPLVDVRDLEWQEWESDAGWWARVDGLQAPNVWVQPWWVEPGRLSVFPTPETVHEAMGRGFVRALGISLLARGARRLVWAPVRGGILWGDFPPPGWGTSLDGGAALREHGATTSTWYALRRLSLQARALLSADFRVEDGSLLRIEGDVEVLAHAVHQQGEAILLRRLAPGETRVRWHVPELEWWLEMSLTGPDGWMFPLRWSLPVVGGELLASTGEVVWREVSDHREIWILDVSQGLDWIMRLDGDLVYETGAEVRREGSLWQVHFEAGQQGQVVWSVGHRRLQVLAVSEEMADRVWPTGLVGSTSLFMGPDRVLEIAESRQEATLRVSTTKPTGLVVVGAHPWRIEVLETGKRSVWGERAGMGGVRLGGPKEWGAPRVPVPDLVWTSMPWDGPFFPGPWEESAPPVERALPPGWHWFQAACPPDWEAIDLQVHGVADVWLGDRRVGGVRSPDRPRARRVSLPTRAGMLPLTIFVWVPSPAWDASERRAGLLHVQGAGSLEWQYRAGVRGVVRDELGHLRLREEGQGEERVACLHLHRCRFALEVPDGVWVQFGLALGDIGELVWIFLNGTMAAQWWAGRSREVALWLPWDMLNARGENEIALLHWPRARDLAPAQAVLVQLCRERVSTIQMVQM